MVPGLAVRRPTHTWKVCPASEANALLSAGRAGEWLNAAEQVVFAGLAVEKRRRDWFAGRVAAKKALRARFPALAPADIEIFNADGGKPSARLPGLAAPELSISHCAKGGLCAVSGGSGPIGADIEPVAAHGPAV